MEVGVVFATGAGTLAGPRASAARPFSAWVADAEKVLRTLDRSGFASAAAAHSYQHNWMQPLVLFARLAASTERLRFSTEILQLPLLNPMDAAYNISLLDNITSGRLDIGVGIGYHAKELEAFGITRADRAPKFEEAIAVMRKFWSGAPVQHEGPYFRCSGIEMALPPFQTPHPPISGASQSEGSARRAARLLNGIIVAPQVTFPDARALVQTFREEWAKTHTEAPTRISAWRTLLAGKDAKDAVDRGIKSGEFTFRRYVEGGMSEKNMVNIRLELKEDDASEWAIPGSYADHLAGLRRCRDELGLTRVTCHFYNLPDDINARCEWLAGFGEEVIAKL